MPEGDTIHDLATRLRPALSGCELREVSVPRVRGMERLRVGDTVVAVESRGKYLEITVDRGVVLRTHLKMVGRWDLYGPDERWRSPRHLARAVLRVDGAVAVCFRAPVVELGRVGDGALDHLGPDLCRPPVDLDAILDRIDALADPHAEIGEVLLEQRLAAGVGNVYRNEVLFACGVHPFRPLGEVDTGTRRALYETAAAQLQANLGRGRRRTLGDGLAVYGREHQGCRVCGTGIRTATRGGRDRTTWWCPRCQPDTGDGQWAARSRSAPRT